MTSDEKLNDYVNRFCEYFENTVEGESSNFHNFSRTFKGKPNDPQNPDNKQSGNEIWDSFEDVFKDKNKHILLLGEPGAGKTVLLREFAKKKAKNWQNKPDFLLPMFVSISTWKGSVKVVEDEGQDEGQEIIDWLIENGIEIEESKHLLKTKLEDEDTQVLLLLDGLDELPENVPKSKSPNSKRENYREKFIKKLNGFIKKQEYKNNSIIVTCRSEDYKEIIEKNEELKLKLNGEIYLQRLNYFDLKKYLLVKLKSNYVFLNKILIALIKNPNLQDFIYTPFILKHLRLWCTSIQDKEKKVEQLNNIRNQYELLDYFIDELYKREKQEKLNEVPFELSEFKQKLGQAAILMMSDDQPDDNEISEKIFNKIFSRDNPKNELNHKYLSLLIPIYGKQTYRFSHLLLRDYFAYSYVEEFFKLKEGNQSTNLEEITKKENIAKALGKLKKLEVTERLIELLKDENSDNNVRYEAVDSLGQLNAGIYFQGYQEDFTEDCLFCYQLSIPDKESNEIEVIKIEEKPKSEPKETDLPEDRPPLASIEQLIKYVSELKNQNEQLLNKLYQGSNQLETLQSQISEAEKKIVTSQSNEISKLKSDNKELQTKVDQASNDLETLQSQLSDTDKKIDDNYQAISQPIEKIYQEILELKTAISELSGRKKRESKNKRDPWNI